MRAHTLLLPLAFGLLYGCKDDTMRAADGASPPATAAEPGPGAMAGTRGTPFPAEVVAIETDGRTITLRETVAGPTGTRQTRAVRIDPTTASAVAALKPGDQVTITCQEVPTAADEAGGTGTTGLSAGLQACSVVVAADPQAR
ncbi:MAG TPA: hypothetical protein VMR21_15720 [Vicinamibacteria bacterium]|nr:hypothetical protein [Vicinamibacteria bacterium]